MKHGFIATFTQTMDETLALAELTERHGWDGFFTWERSSPSHFDHIHHGRFE